MNTYNSFRSSEGIAGMYLDEYADDSAFIMLNDFQNDPPTTSPRSNSLDESSTESSTNYEEPIINLNSTVSIDLDGVQEENNLIKYTENHFLNKLTSELVKLHNTDLSGQLLNENIIYRDIESNMSIRDNYIYNNSPLSMSPHGSHNTSRSGSWDGRSAVHSLDESYDLHKSTYKKQSRPLHYKKYKPLAYDDVERSINKYYDTEIDNKYSSELDILTTYVKGQKHLYIQSKHITQRKLNCLMIPALFFTTSITIIAPFIECKYWSGGVISALNACIALFISLINYLKYESSIESYLQMANHYDKLETSLEMANGKLIFIDSNENKAKLVLVKIKEVETKITDIKETNNIFIPEEVKLLFPIICHINIFSFIKKMEIYRSKLIIKFKDVKNEIRYILHKWKSNNASTNSITANDDLDKLKEKSRLLFLYDVKETIKNEILEYRSAYGEIDEIFTKEIKNADSIKNSYFFWFILFYKSKPSVPYFHGQNAVIDKYLKFIFVD